LHGLGHNVFFPLSWGLNMAGRRYLRHRSLDSGLCCPAENISLTYAH
jgi:hypothetical protein